MKNSKLLLLILSIGLFIWINILIDWILLIFLSFFLLTGYIIVCIVEIHIKSERSVPKKYNIIEVIKNSLDKLPQLIKNKKIN